MYNQVLNFSNSPKIFLLYLPNKQMINGILNFFVYHGLKFHSYQSCCLLVLSSDVFVFFCFSVVCTVSILYLVDNQSKFFFLRESISYRFEYFWILKYKALRDGMWGRVGVLVFEKYFYKTIHKSFIKI